MCLLSYLTQHQWLVTTLVKNSLNNNCLTYHYFNLFTEIVRELAIIKVCVLYCAIVYWKRLDSGSVSVCVYFCVFVKERIIMGLNCFQLYPMWGVPCWESATETVILTCHDTEQSDSKCWTCFYTDTRSEFFAPHHGWYNFIATCHSHFHTQIWWVGVCGFYINSI